MLENVDGILNLPTHAKIHGPMNMMNGNLPAYAKVHYKNSAVVPQHWKQP